MIRSLHRGIDSRPVRFAACITLAVVAWSASTARAQFGPEQLIDVFPEQIVFMHPADLDGDGKVDLVVCRTAGPQKLAWYRNLGGGAFGPAQPLPIQPLQVFQAETIDVGADGDLDLVVVVANDHPPFLTYRVDLYVNLGGGIFAVPSTILPEAAIIPRIATADLEGDGDIDLFSARGSTVVALRFQGGSYATLPYSVTSTAVGLSDFALSDLDLDGDADLITSSLQSGSFQRFENVGLSSAFTGPHAIDASATPGYEVESADLDNDNLADVVGIASNGTTTDVRWYKNLGAGAFGSAQVITGTISPQRILCTDVDRDGDQDVVVREIHGAFWYANDGSGGFGSIRTVSVSLHDLRSMALADVDGDGATDVVLGSVDGTGGGRLAWFQNGTPTLVTYCFGDGSGAACPCNNAGAAGNGCASSIDPGGARLSSHGAYSVGNDSLVLDGSHMPNSSALYFQGTTQVAGGNGLPFGDGLRCVGGVIVRLGTKTNVAGSSADPAAGDLPLSIRGGVAAGDVRRYQCWYRNAAAYCTTATYNLTNALEVTWAP